MNKELRLGILLNYLYIAISFASSLLLTPIMRNSLGDVHFGLYALVVTVGTYLLINEFGIGNVIIRYISKFIIEKDKKSEENFLCTAFFVYVLFSIAALIFCVLVNANARFMFGAMETDLVNEFKTLYSLMSANVFVLFYMNYFFSIVTGYEKFVFARTVIIIKMVVRAASIVACLLCGMGAVWIFIIDLSLTIINTIIFGVYCAVVLKVKIKFHFIDKKLINKLFARISFIYFTLILDNVYWNVSGAFLGMTGATAEVGKFLIAINLCVLFTQISGAVVGYFLPSVTKLVVEKAGNNALTQLMINVARWLNMIMCLVILEFAFLGRELIELWLGSGFYETYLLALIMMAALWYPQIQSLGETVLQAQNRYGVRTAIYLFSTLICILFSWLMIENYGINGAWIGIVLSILVFRVAIMNIYYNRIGLDMKTFFTGTIPRMMMVAAVSAGVSWVVNWWQSSSIAGLAIKGLIILCVYTVCIWIFYLKDQERQYGLVTMKKIIDFL